MHIAAVGGQLEMIKFLSQAFPTKVHERASSDGYTMLHWAAWMGHCEVARYLIEEVKMDPQDKTKVCGGGMGEGGVSKVQALFVLIITCDNINGVTWTCM